MGPGEVLIDRRALLLLLLRVGLLEQLLLLLVLVVLVGVVVLVLMRMLVGVVVMMGDRGAGLGGDLVGRRRGWGRLGGGRLGSRGLTLRAGRRDRRELQLDEHHVIAEAHRQVQGGLAREEVVHLGVAQALEGLHDALLGPLGLKKIQRRSLIISDGSKCLSF